MVEPGSILSRNVRVIRAALASGLALTLGLSFVMPLEEVPLSSCLFRELTGMSCLTCGLSRSLQATSHGDLLAAFQFHLLGPFVFAGVLVAAVVCVAEALRGKRLWLLRHAGLLRPALLGVTGIWIVYGVVRAIVELV